MPQQSSSSSREEQGQWVAKEDRRRIVFETTAKRVLKCLEGSDDVKVGVTELQENSWKYRKKQVFPLRKLHSKQ